LDTGKCIYLHKSRKWNNNVYESILAYDKYLIVVGGKGIYQIHTKTGQVINKEELGLLGGSWNPLDIC